VTAFTYRLSASGVKRTARTPAFSFLELGDAHCIAPELFLNHAQWNVALFQVEDLRRPAKPLRQRYEIRVGRDHREAICFRPVPDDLISGARQSDVAEVRQAGKQRAQPLHQARRQVLAEEQFHPMLTLRPISAA
jgi:hypothetical protein